MSTAIPTLEHFVLEPRTPENPVSTADGTVRLTLGTVGQGGPRRLAAGLLDPSRRLGMAVAFYPATGEVCDLCQGAGVIGYLEPSSLKGHGAWELELTLEQCGPHRIGQLRIAGEAFSYPAFLLDETTLLTPFTGPERAADAA